MKRKIGLNKTSRILAAAVAACAMISSAHAVLVTQVFSGVVTQVGASSATLGNAVTATLVYDSEQAPTTPFLDFFATYGEFDLSIVTDGFSPSTTGGNMFVFDNYTDDPSGDPVDAFGANNGNDVFLYLIDPSMTAFQSIMLPTALTLSDFLTAEIAVIFGPGDSNRFIASLTSVETTIGAPSEVPLPAAFWMMVLGLGALGRYSRKNLRG